MRPVRRQNVAPVHARVAQKAVDRYRFTPAIAGGRDARLEIRGKSFDGYRLVTHGDYTALHLRPAMFQAAIKLNWFFQSKIPIQMGSSIFIYAF